MFLRQGQSRRLLRGLEGGQQRRGEEISHVPFANDILVFYQLNEDWLTHLSWVLLWFKALSGLKTNLEKSEIISMILRFQLKLLSVLLGWISSYLGLLLGALFKSVALWDGVKERLPWRLALWKQQYISKGGNLTLIRVLFPICLSTLCWQFAFGGYLIVVGKIQRNFLQEAEIWSKNLISLIGPLFCTSKFGGRLGVRRLKILNRTLLDNGAGAMWKRGGLSGIVLPRVSMRRRREDAGGWRCVYEVNVAIRIDQDIIGQGMAFMVGNGRRVKNWRNK